MTGVGIGVVDGAADSGALDSGADDSGALDWGAVEVPAVAGACDWAACDAGAVVAVLDVAGALLGAGVLDDPPQATTNTKMVAMTGSRSLEMLIAVLLLVLSLSQRLWSWS
jgi:hypothetical protein